MLRNLPGNYIAVELQMGFHSDFLMLDSSFFEVGFASGQFVQKPFHHYWLGWHLWLREAIPFSIF